MAAAPPSIIGRDAASALGLKRFFTGEPCKHGHVAERIVSSHRCTECDRASALKWRAANLEKARETSTEPLTRKETGKKGAGGGPRTRTSELPRGSPSGPPLSCARTGSTSGKPPPNGKRRVLHQSLPEPDRPACNEGKSLDPETQTRPWRARRCPGKAGEKTVI